MPNSANLEDKVELRRYRRVKISIEQLLMIVSKRSYVVGGPPMTDFPKDVKFVRARFYGDDKDYNIQAYDKNTHIEVVIESASFEIVPDFQSVPLYEVDLITGQMKELPL